MFDLIFLNKDTGWVCSDDLFDGGVFKTTNGGLSWLRQSNPNSRPIKVFFVNNDTGWFGSSNWKLYRTTNGGANWNLQFTTNIPISSIFFLNSQKGWITGGGTINGCLYTTNSGINWIGATGNTAVGIDVKFVNDSIGYSGSGYQRVAKSTDGGKSWGYQSVPITDALQISVLRGDSLHAWAGYYGLVKTTDGGGPIVFTGIQQISTEVPKEYKLYQNYPNPFNPTTYIKYSVRSQTSSVKLIVFDVQGKEIAELVNQQQSAGTYETDWNASVYSSGIYFYSLIIDGITIDTKKMILLK